MIDPTVHPDEPTKYPTDGEAQNYAKAELAYARAALDYADDLPSSVLSLLAKAYRDGHAVGYRWGGVDGYGPAYNKGYREGRVDTLGAIIRAPRA